MPFNAIPPGKANDSMSEAQSSITAGYSLTECVPTRPPLSPRRVDGKIRRLEIAIASMLFAPADLASVEREIH